MSSFDFLTLLITCLIYFRPTIYHSVWYGTLRKVDSIDSRFIY